MKCLNRFLLLGIVTACTDGSTPPTPPANYALTVIGVGTGAGSVTGPGGINCSALQGSVSGPCGAPFASGSSVSLTASAASGSVFAGWGGACSGTGSCQLAMSQARTVTATFITTAVPKFTLNVTRAGAGNGTVTSNSGGINCGATCSAPFDSATAVTLTAVAAGGSVFSGWSGACTGTGSCQVTMSQARSVAATFNVTAATQFALAVTKAGTGSGTVTSSLTGVNCGVTCSAPFDSGTVVTLSPVSSSGSVFAGWSGECTSTGSCQVTMSQGRSVTATFSLTQGAQFTLAVTRAGGGGGTVTSNPGGINCGATCSAPFDSATVVTLTATAAGGSSFGGWSGACSGTGNCLVTLSQARAVSATFNVSQTRQFSLGVSKAGAGSGTVTSSPSGINCGVTCSAPFDSGTVVTLAAVAPSGSVFAGWSGACSGTGNCEVTMVQGRLVTASFNLTEATQYTLFVGKAGTGSGTVTSTPSGVNCGTACSVAFNSGTVVALGQMPAAGSAFGGWTGHCTGTGGCLVTMSQPRTVTATFNPTHFTLTVLKAGTGTGTVTSSPSGISCGTTCSAPFSAGTVVTLTPMAGANSAFAGWTGACAGAGCVVTMSEARTVTAVFILKYTLTVSKTSSGRGTVTSNPSGIACGAACSAMYNSGTDVLLTASPYIASRFNGWGSLCGGLGTCLVTMTVNRSLSPAFDPCPHSEELGGGTVRGKYFFGTDCVIEGRQFQAYGLPTAASPYAVVRSLDFAPGLDLWNEPTTRVRTSRVSDFSSRWPSTGAVGISLHGAVDPSWLLVRNESSNSGWYEFAYTVCGTSQSANPSGTNQTSSTLTTSNSCLLSGGNRLRVHMFVLDNTWTGFSDDVRLIVQTTGFTGKICLYKYPFGAEDELECDSYLTGGLTIDHDLGSNSAGMYALYVYSDPSSVSKTGSYVITLEKR